MATAVRMFTTPVVVWDKLVKLASKQRLAAGLEQVILRVSCEMSREGPVKERRNTWMIIARLAAFLMARTCLLRTDRAGAPAYLKIPLQSLRLVDKDPQA